MRLFQGEIDLLNQGRRRSIFFYMFTIIIVYTETEPIYVKAGVYGAGVGQGYNAIPDQVSGTITPSPAIIMSRFEPYFDHMIPQNVTALVGKSAYLSCRVRNLGNKTVSWIRHRDLHILTVGTYTYTTDQRFQANHHRQTDEWILQIKYAQKRDAGRYECQISTQPVRSYFVELDVVVPTAAILGEPDLHVDKGSTINLTCLIKYGPEPPAYIFWYHSEENIYTVERKVESNDIPAQSKNGSLLWLVHRHVISYDSSRGGVSVITEKGDVTTSFLLIQNADINDSGKYSCHPSNADVASIRVHVLNAESVRTGERPAAMQTGSACLANSSLNILVLLILTLLYRNLYRHVDIHLSVIPRYP